MYPAEGVENAMVNSYWGGSTVAVVEAAGANWDTPAGDIRRKLEDSQTLVVQEKKTAYCTVGMSPAAVAVAAASAAADGVAAHTGRTAPNPEPEPCHSGSREAAAAAAAGTADIRRPGVADPQRTGAAGAGTDRRRSRAEVAEDTE